MTITIHVWQEPGSKFWFALHDYGDCPQDERESSNGTTHARAVHFAKWDAMQEMDEEQYIPDEIRFVVVEGRP